MRYQAKFRLWHPVSHRFMLKSTVGNFFLAYPVDSEQHGVLFAFEPGRFGSGPGVVRYAHTADLNRPRRRGDADERARLGAVVRELLEVDKFKIVACPPVRWGDPRRWSWGSRSTTEILQPGTVRLDGGNVVQYALAKQRGEHPEVRALAERRSDAEALVEEIREEFGMLGTDIVYRIDNSALFDTSVPATEQFHAALITFADLGDAAPVAQVEAQAAEVEVSYSLARANAERLGLSHLPETARDDARRASKAAHLAANASTDGERVASLTQAARILDSLALYYLPRINPETAALEAPSER